MLRNPARAVVFVAIAALGLAVSTPALAQMVEGFDKLCIATDARNDRTEEAAVGMGWLMAPPAVTKRVHRPGGKSTGWVPPGENAKSVSVAVTTFIPEVDQGVDSVFALCVAIGAEDATVLEAGVARILGKPFINGRGQHVWMYSREGDRFVSETGLFNGGEGALQKAWMARSVYTVTVIREDTGQGSIMMMAARRPDPK